MVNAAADLGQFFSKYPQSWRLCTGECVILLMRLKFKNRGMIRMNISLKKLFGLCLISIVALSVSGQEPPPMPDPPSFPTWGYFEIFYHNDKYDPITHIATYEIMITGLIEEVEHVEIPESIGSSPVTKIYRRAFKDCHFIKSVSIPDSVVTIEHGAFQNCTNLQEIVIHDFVTRMGDDAFNGCTSLMHVSIGEGLASLNRRTFAGCINLSQIDIPSNIANIEQGCFADCTALKSIYLPQGLVSIEQGSFDNCVSLETITIPQSVEYIGLSPFTHCENLKFIEVETDNPVYASVGGVLYSKDLTELVIFPEGLDTTFTIPYGVTHISRGAFSENCSIAGIGIPGSLEKIPIAAFRNCSSLTTINFEEGVRMISGFAFENCNSLQEVDIPDSVETIEAWAFKGCSLLKTISLGSGLKNFGSVGDELHDWIWDDYFVSSKEPGLVFLQCDQLGSISVSEDNPQFADLDGALCSKDYTKLILAPRGLEGVYIVPDGINDIGEEAFYGCPNLTEIIVPNSVTGIGNAAFAACDRLSSLTIGSGLESLGCIFWWSSGYYWSTRFPTLLTRILFLGEPPPFFYEGWKDSFFNDSNPDLTIYYLEGTPGWGPTYGGKPTQALPAWGHYPLCETSEGCFVEADDWLGLLEVSCQPWVYCYQAAEWYYIPEPDLDASSGWVHVPDTELTRCGLNVTLIPGTDFGYSHATNRWIYDAGLGWVYVF